MRFVYIDIDKSCLPSRPALLTVQFGIHNGTDADPVIQGRDRLQNTIAEGGPYHTRGKLQEYLARLRANGREGPAARLEQRHGR